MIDTSAPADPTPHLIKGGEITVTMTALCLTNQNSMSLLHIMYPKASCTPDFSTRFWQKHVPKR